MKLQLPTIYTFNRSINPTDGLLYGMKSKTREKIPVEVISRGMLGPISDYKSAQSYAGKDPSKVKNASGLNPMTIDYASLPLGCDALVLEFSVIFVGNAITPKSVSRDGVGDNGLHSKVSEFLRAYKEKDGFTELAYRYLKNIVEGMPLWRNRTTGGNVIVEVKQPGIGERTFEPASGSRFPRLDRSDEWVNRISQILSSDGDRLEIQVSISIEMPEAAEVYPSQCYIKDSNDKVLAGINRGSYKHAIVHQQKIGNAVRTIDDWYEKDALYPIAVEPLGLDRRQDRAVRASFQNDFYNLITKNIISYIDLLGKGEVTGDMHYLAACLVRGGIFNNEKK